MLAATGAAAGLALAWWAKDALPRMLEDDVILDTAIDVRAVAFAGGLTALTALVFGVGHAVRATGGHAMPWLKTTTRTGGQRALVARTLIGVQIAASLVLLVVAGLFVRTLYNYSRVDVGFDTTNMLVFRIDPGPSPGKPATTFDLYERLMSAPRRCPSAVGHLVSDARRRAQSVDRDGACGWRRRRAMGPHTDSPVEFLRDDGNTAAGRPRTQSSDDDGAPRVAMINAAMARQMFNEDVPVGRHFQFVNGRDRAFPFGSSAWCRTRSIRTSASRLRQPSCTSAPPQRMTVEVRTAGDALALTASVRAAVSRVDPGLPLMQVRTQKQQIAETIRGPRTFAALTAVSGAIGLLLACIGLYGVVSYDAKRRTNEIGVRMAPAPGGPTCCGS